MGTILLILIIILLYEALLCARHTTYHYYLKVKNKKLDKELNENYKKYIKLLQEYTCKENLWKINIRA